MYDARLMKSSTSSPTRVLWAVLAALGLSLAACGASAAPSGDPAQAIESYLQARAVPDADKMISLSCAAWEPQARLEFTSIQGRSPQLENLACTASNADGATALVTCQGKIVTSYDGEQREFDLAERPFKAAQEGGEWRMCGYQ
jgi:hypothetical protein